MYALTNIVAHLVPALLLAIASFHLLWALGMYWPCKTEEELAKAVVGTRGITRMPSRYATAVVALLLVFAAFWAFVMHDRGPIMVPKIIGLLGGVSIATVFLTRGFFGLMPAMERYTPEQPFLKLNRRFYSPLSLVIGFGFVWLVAAMPNWTWRLGLVTG